LSQSGLIVYWTNVFKLLLRICWLVTILVIHGSVSAREGRATSRTFNHISGVVLN